MFAGQAFSPLSHLLSPQIAFNPRSIELMHPTRTWPQWEWEPLTATGQRWRPQVTFMDGVTSRHRVYFFWTLAGRDLGSILAAQRVRNNSLALGVSCAENGALESHILSCKIRRWDRRWQCLQPATLQCNWIPATTLLTIPYNYSLHP